MIRLVIIVLCVATTGVFSSPLPSESKSIPNLAKHDPAVANSVLSGSKSVLPASKVDPPTSRQECRAANEEFDRALALANQDFLKKGNPSVPVDGFQQYVYLSYSGASLFVKFNLKTSGGSLRLSAATRAGNATVCYAETDSSSSDDVSPSQSEDTLYGVLQFGELELKYDELHAEYFKSSNLYGTLTYTVRPSVNVVVNRSSDACHLDVVDFVATSDDEYTVTSDSWKDWIVAKLVGTSLKEGGDSTPILQYVLDGLRKSIEAHFVKIWCDKTSFADSSK